MRLSILSAVLVVAACAGPQAELAIRAPQTLEGMPKGDLLACAGVPDRSTTGPDGTEYLAYSRHQTSVHRDFGYESYGWMPGLFGPDADSWTTNYSCTATFALRNGRVGGLTYNADRDIQLCYRIVGACLGR